MNAATSTRGRLNSSSSPSGIRTAQASPQVRRESVVQSGSVSSPTVNIPNKM